MLHFLGCDQKPPATPSWDNAGFVTHVPRDTEGFLSLQKPMKHWRHLQPMWNTFLSDPALQASWRKSPWGQIAGTITSSETLAPLGRAILEADSDEYIFILQRGAATPLAAALQMQRLFKSARLQNLFTPSPAENISSELPTKSHADSLEAAAFTDISVPLTPAMEEALKKIVKDISVPPFLVGIKLHAKDESLPKAFKTWAEALSDKFLREKFVLAPHGEFTRVRTQIAYLLPKGAAQRGRDALAATIGDPYTATDLLRTFISKPIVISFGEAFGYFFVMIGPDNASPVFAENFETSLAALPAMAPLASQSPSKIAALFYADALLVGLSVPPPPLQKYLDAALVTALEFAPAEHVESLSTSATTLQRQTDALFHPLVAAVSGTITREESGWNADVFGGPLPPRLAQENGRPLLEMNPDWALLWTEYWQDDYSGNLLQFAGNLSAFAAQWTTDLGPLILDPKKSAWIEKLLHVLQESSAHLAQIEPTSWDTAFDRRRALALAFDKATPTAGKSLWPRVALMAGIQDRKVLGENGAALASSLWHPTHTNSLPSGGISYEFSWPSEKPNEGLTVTLENQRWILGFPSSFTQTLGEAPTPLRGTDSLQRIYLTTVPWAALATTWADAIEADPSLAIYLPDFLPHNPQTLRTTAILLQEPYQLRYEARWEGKLLHRTIQLSPHP